MSGIESVEVMGTAVTIYSMALGFTTPGLILTRLYFN